MCLPAWLVGHRLTDLGATSTAFGRRHSIALADKSGGMSWANEPAGRVTQAANGAASRGRLPDMPVQAVSHSIHPVNLSLGHGSSIQEVSG